MTKHIVQLPTPDGSLLLRELNHRIKNELTSAIHAVSAKAVKSDSVAVKAALLDVVDLLHQCADVHRRIDAGGLRRRAVRPRSEEHTSELQSHHDLVCRLLLEKKKKV